MFSEFQKAILSAITSDWQLSAILVSVKDRQGAVADGGDSSKFPYVHVNSEYDVWDTDTTDGFQVVTRIHTWSRSGSNAQTMAIQGHLYRVFHNSEIPVTGGHPVLMKQSGCEILDDPDGVTIHGVSEFRTLLDSAT